MANLLQTADQDGMKRMLEAFSNPQKVARYAEGPPRYVPGFEALHRMTGILLAERAPPNAKVLVVGAGGGLELKALAQAQPGWSFVGVDPSQEMLRIGEQALGPLMSRVRLLRGYIDDAPEGPFDAAVCLLTLHFLDADERTRTAGEIHRRLKRDAPFVAAHASFPQGKSERSRWLARYAAYGVASGGDRGEVENARATVEAHLHLFDETKDEAILRAAGFQDVELFFTAFTWRGWVAYA